ncbi:MAG TPA: FtsK/SpoIIIE domain-containing protein, partial [Anaerolineae bacterium]|nr:FtsK/SpoIIIE domain-containing protein [Anaerolineae bacterium]
ELADLALTGGKGVLEALGRLAQRGREAGLHVIACTQKPATSVLGSVTKANFPVRLVGRVTSLEDARVATGLGGSGAERLSGRGDFLAVSGAGMTRFQAAFIAPDEIANIVCALQSANGRPAVWEQTTTIEMLRG